MMRKQTTVLILLVVALGVTVSGAGMPGAAAQTADSAGVRLLSSSAAGVTFEVGVPWNQVVVERVAADGKMYARVGLDDWANLSHAGLPELPYLSQTVGVPVGAEVSVRVVAGPAHTIALGEAALPAPSRVLDWSMATISAEGIVEPAVRDVVEPDAAVYDGRTAYPGVLGEVVSDGVMRYQRVVGVAAYPVQYDPTRHSLTVYEWLRVEVRFTGAAVASEFERDAVPQDSIAYEGVLAGALLNYEDARPWRTETEASLLPSDATTAVTPWAPPEPGWRIAVRGDGMYILTYADLAAAGVLAGNPDPRTFRMLYQGEEIAIQVVGESDGEFGTSDAVIFYGQERASKYSHDNIYWLTFGQGNGLRMQPRDGAPGTAATPAYYRSTLHYELNEVYVSTALGPDELERWFANVLYPPVQPTLNYDLVLEAPYSGEYVGNLRVVLFGLMEHAINPDHHVKVLLNDVEVGDIWFDGRTWYTFEAAVPQSLLRPGANRLTLTHPNDTGVGSDVIYFDWAELEYAASLSAHDDVLAFGYDVPASRKYVIEGFNHADVMVYDVSDPTHVVLVEGMDVQASGGAYQAQFEDQTMGPVAYVATASTAYRTVTSIVQDTPSNLRSTANGADHLVITHSAFSDAAARLSAHRASQGLRAQVVDIQDVYDEFGYGVVGTEALRSFLAYAYTSWQKPAPSYVVLMGDGHYDPKNYAGYGRTSFIPPYLAAADPWIVETAADNRYVAVAGADQFPDMMLGRIAVNSSAQADAVVDKVIAYEESPAPGDWSRRILAVADNADSGGNFSLISDSLLACCVPSSYQVERVYYGVTHSTQQAARAAVKSSFNAGNLIVNYIGHASTNAWASENLLTTNDVAGLANDARMPVMLSMTCRDGFYHSPDALTANREALAEVITRVSGKGAVAAWSPTGLGVASGHDYLNRGFMQAVFGAADGRITVGQATIAGKLRLWATGTNLDLLDTYLLFGDPALMLTVGQVFEQTLSAGWNLVSFNVDPTSNGQPISQVDDVLASIAGSYDLVLSYDSADEDDPWKVYNPGGMATTNTLTELFPGQGFWVRMLNADTWTLVGQPVAGLTIELSAGWNMIGWPLQSQGSLPGAFGSIAAKYLSVWTYLGDEVDEPWLRYGPAAPEWVNNLTELNAGRGYWIHASEGCTLTLP